MNSEAYCIINKEFFQWLTSQKIHEYLYIKQIKSQIYAKISHFLSFIYDQKRFICIPSTSFIYSENQKKVDWIGKIPDVIHRFCF